MPTKRCSAHTFRPPLIIRCARTPSGDIFEPWSDDVGKAAFYRQIAQADAGAIEEAQNRYAKTEFEVHVTWGMRDTFIPAERGRQIADLLQAKSFTPVPDAAHIVQEDAPAALLGSLMQHI